MRVSGQRISGGSFFQDLDLQAVVLVIPADDSASKAQRIAPSVLEVVA